MVQKEKDQIKRCGARSELSKYGRMGGNNYKGIGIKRMKGYKSNLPINKFNEQLEKFWMTKNEDENRRIIQKI